MEAVVTATVIPFSSWFTFRLPGVVVGARLRLFSYRICEKRLKVSLAEFGIFEPKMHAPQLKELIKGAGLKLMELHEAQKFCDDCILYNYLQPADESWYVLTEDYLFVMRRLAGEPKLSIHDLNSGPAWRIEDEHEKFIVNTK